MGNLLNASSFILPDIFLDRNTAPDVYRGTAYHEMSHASHFTNVGADWWQHLTQFELEHEGHGDNADQNDPDAGYCAVGESWADHLGDLFTANNLMLPIPNENLVQEANGWIPEGIYFDLWDASVEPVATGITDNVSGFTNEMILDVLDENVTTINEIEISLWNEYGANPQVIAPLIDYTVLFNSYGY